MNQKKKRKKKKNNRVQLYLGKNTAQACPVEWDMEGVGKDA